MRPVVFLEKELRIYYTKAQPDKDELEGAERYVYSIKQTLPDVEIHSLQCLIIIGRWFDAWYSKKKQVKKSSSCHF